ncbi:MAG: hypothetical protein SNH35_08755 [Rikenellaceae bacterium]
MRSLFLCFIFGSVVSFAVAIPRFCRRCRQDLSYAQPPKYKNRGLGLDYSVTKSFLATATEMIEPIN